MPETALIVIDMLNHYEHDDAEPLAESAAAIIEPLTSLVARADPDETLVAYVNDNHGDWEAGREQLVERALAGAHPELVRPVVPDPSLPFVIKGRHSIFYMTAVDELLRSHDVRRVILAGQVTEQCILYSSLDAYLRQYEIVVPTDAVAHIHPDLADAALCMMERNMHATLVSAESCDLSSSPTARTRV
jgi:nicotinamidase-related amidase